MTNDESRPVLSLFAREPVAGACKTRLVPALGAEGAARLAAAMLGWTADTARRHWPGPVRIAVWPPGSGARFASGLGLSTVDQRGHDLGERMHGALTEVAAPGAVLGCDVPHVRGAVLARAGAVLSAGSNVVGPAEDGGFYLLGLVRPVPGLFDGIAWGGADVYARLAFNAARAGARFVELDTLRDIDTPSDLEAVAPGFAPLGRFLAGDVEARRG